METACRHVTKAGAVFRQPLPAGVAQVVCCTLMAKAAPSMAADRSNRHHSQSVMQPNTSPLPLCALQHHTTVGRCTPETWVRMLPPPKKILQRTSCRLPPCSASSSSASSMLSPGDSSRSLAGSHRHNNNPQAGGRRGCPRIRTQPRFVQGSDCFRTLLACNGTGQRTTAV